jgi:AcrR family transcriptional regulator
MPKTSVKRRNAAPAAGVRRAAARAAPPAAARNPRRSAGAAPSERNATAERILGAALKVFASNGFDGTTTREIAARAGVNLGLLKYYFDGKEKLWKAAVDEVFADLWRTVGAGAAGAAADAGQIADTVRACVRFAARNPAFVRLMNDECKREGPRMRWLVDRHGKPLFELALAVLESARAARRLPDVPGVHLYYAFVGALGLMFSQAPECERLTGVDPTHSDVMIEAHADAIVALFLRRPTPHARRKVAARARP